MPTTPKRYFWVVFIFLLAACATPAMPPAPTKAPTFTSVLATPTDLPTAVLALTSTRTPEPTPTRLPLFTLAGLRVAYIIDGNLYVQDSGGQPIQLTHSGQDRSPIFSHDGQKIVFYRGARKQINSIYAINANGNDEEALAPSAILTVLGLGYNHATQAGSPAFVPGTHQLLFQTYQPDSVRIGAGGVPWLNKNHDLLLIDLDNGKIRQVLPPGKASYFQPSPNGKLVWVLSEDHLDVIGLNGKVVRRLKDYPSGVLDTNITMPEMYWTQDSRKLSLILPPAKSAFDYNGPEAKTVWQTSLDGSGPIEIHFIPSPVDAFSVSPDGNWIVYTYCCLQTETDKPAITGMYLGNLRMGTAEFIWVAGLAAFPSGSFGMMTAIFG